MSAARAAAAAWGALVLLAPFGAFPAQAHAQPASLGDLPVLLFEPQVVTLAPGEAVERVFNTTTVDRIAWWTVVLCHCESHRLLFTIDGPPGTLGEQFLVARPVYHHYALYFVHWDGTTALTWKNMGNKTLVIEFRAGIWPAEQAQAEAPAGAGSLPTDTAALAAGLAAMGAAAWWARRAAPTAPRARRQRRALRRRPPERPGALLFLGLAAAIAVSGAAPWPATPAKGADGAPPPPGPPTRAAPPPEANLTVVKVTAPGSGATVNDTVTIRGVAYVNETDAARLGVLVTLERVFVSFNFGPFEPAEGVANWTLSWDSAPFDNGLVWVGAAALDSMGNYSYDWVRVFVENGAHPVASASAASARGFAPFSTNFTGAGQDPDGTVAQLLWDFGDGGNASGAEVNHTFAAPGLYRVTLTAVDNRSTLGRALLNITVLDPAGQPQCTPRAQIQQGPDSLTVSFGGDAWDDGSIAAVDWDFGDGASASGLNATHTYTAAGNYRVTMRVRDDGGNSGSSALQITVPEPLRARTDFANLQGAGAPPDFKGLLEVYTAVPEGKRVSVILPPLRQGDEIAWRFVACACAGLRNLSFWVESPAGERLLEVAVKSASVLIVGRNVLQVNASGVYQLVWESGGPGDVEIGYTVQTRTRDRGPGPTPGPSALLLAAAGVWAGAAALAGLGLVGRRAARGRFRAPDPRAGGD